MEKLTSASAAKPIILVSGYLVVPANRALRSYSNATACETEETNSFRRDIFGKPRLIIHQLGDAIRYWNLLYLFEFQTANR